MWYALAKNQDYFAKRVNRYVALASCLFADSYEWASTYDKVSKIYHQFEKNGIYNLYGGDESSIGWGAIECYADGGDNDECKELVSYWDLFEYGAESSSAFLYFMQLSLEMRF